MPVDVAGEATDQAGGAAAGHALSVVSAKRGLGLFHEQAVLGRHLTS